MSMQKMTHEIALDIKKGLFSREEALEKYSFLDADELDEALEMMDSIRYSEDGTIIIKGDWSWYW